MVPGSDRRNDRFLLVGVTLVLLAAAVGLAFVGSLARRDAPRPVQADAAFAETAVETPSEPTALESATAVHTSAEAWRAWTAREYATAASLYAAELAASPRNANAAYMLGLAAWKSGDLEAAAGALGRAAELEPNSLRVQLNLSRIHNARGDAEAALRAADRALALDPLDPTALYQRARSLRNLGRVEDAVVVLKDCLGRRPGYGHALNLLGLIHLDRGEVGPAVDAFDSAATLEPEVAFVQRNLGLALERAGRPEEAVVAYRRAAEIDAGRAVVGEPESLPVAVAVAATELEPPVPAESD